MSRTIRRGNPSRNYHKYISLGIIEQEENLRAYRWWPIQTADDRYPVWKDSENDPTTYEEYASYEIRRYHMDFRPRTTVPNCVHRLDIQQQKRAIKAILDNAVRTGDFDVSIPKMGHIGKRIWDWW